MLNWFIFVYLDDILSYSPSEAEHMIHVQSVFSRTICMLRRRSASSMFLRYLFSGFIVSSGQVRMEPAKVQGVSSWPIPECQKQVQRFWGFATSTGSSSTISLLSLLHSTGSLPLRRGFAGHLRPTELFGNRGSVRLLCLLSPILSSSLRLMHLIQG